MADDPVTDMDLASVELMVRMLEAAAVPLTVEHGHTLLRVCRMLIDDRTSMSARNSHLERALGVRRDLPVPYRWLVVRKVEDQPVELWGFADGGEAAAFWKQAGWQWSGCYLCQIVDSDERSRERTEWRERGIEIGALDAESLIHRIIAERDKLRADLAEINERIEAGEFA